MEYLLFCGAIDTDTHVLLHRKKIKCVLVKCFVFDVAVILISQATPPSHTQSYAEAHEKGRGLRD